MQNVAPARTYAEEIQNKPNYMKIIGTTSELLELIRKDFVLKQQNNPFYQEYHLIAEILTAFMRKHTTVWQQCN